jgi:Icc-related predicted phosphoesterase
MLVAAIYDIHANLPALEAVLEEIRQVGADHVVVGGDVLPGPMPRETLTYLLDLGIPVQFIYGNGEIAVLEQMAGKDPATVPEHYRPVIRWTAQQLRPRAPRNCASLGADKWKSRPWQHLARRLGELLNRRSLMSSGK